MLGAVAPGITFEMYFDKLPNCDERFSLYEITQR